MDEMMDAYLKLIQDVAQHFNQFNLTRIPRAKHAQADTLAVLA